jgi:cytochrome c-type biogenesis protein CcmF
MAIAPALPWRATSGEVLQNRLLGPAYVGALTMVATLVMLTRDWTTVVGFGLAAFSLAAIGRETFVAVRARRRADSIGWVRSYGRTMTGNPRRYGGLIVHTGVVVIAVALASSGSFGTKQEVRLRLHQSATVGGYTVRYVGSHVTKNDQKNSVSVALAVSHDGDRLGTYAPAISTFRNAQEGIGTPSVRTGLVEDVYLTLVSSPSDRGRITVGVAIQSMTVWIWIGGVFMALGTIVALSLRIRRRVVRAPEVDGDDDDPDRRDTRTPTAEISEPVPA